MVQKHKNKLNIRWLCSTVGVSRSGYYSYVKKLTSKAYLLREKKEQADFELILKAYNFKNRKKGSRSIKMTLEHRFNIIMNLKKIRRLMKKFGLICPIRKANPYRRMQKQIIIMITFNREFYEATPVEYRIYLLEGGNPLLHKKETNCQSIQLASN